MIKESKPNGEYNVKDIEKQVVNDYRKCYWGTQEEEH